MSKIQHPQNQRCHLPKDFSSPTISSPHHPRNFLHQRHPHVVSRFQRRRCTKSSRLSSLKWPPNSNGTRFISLTPWRKIRPSLRRRSSSWNLTTIRRIGNERGYEIIPGRVEVPLGSRYSVSSPYSFRSSSCSSLFGLRDGNGKTYVLPTLDLGTSVNIRRMLVCPRERAMSF